ncbi:MAG: DNA-binding response regulator [Sphingobacteriales bacterium]|jgi:DNA-binding LytR/AlgR family response regulator|nr:MAG: DNA-binding response regulator [Sphingobacteriales bacterium]
MNANKYLTCIVIDDEDMDRWAIIHELSNFETIKVLGNYNNPIEAIAFIKLYKPDILFLDIDMPEINGLEFIKMIKNEATINIIISSHPEYALEGFQLNVFDYILKPVETYRLASCVDRLLEFTNLKNKAQAYDVLVENEKIIFKDGHNVVNINATEILYLEAYGDYTKIVTENKAHLTLATLSNFMDLLPQGKFLRIHRSYVIAINRVKCFNLKTIDIGENVLPVGKTYLRNAKLSLM